MFKKLCTVIYHVENLDEAKAWYKNITGIDPYFDRPFYVGFDINGCELGLDPDATNVIKIINNLDTNFSIAEKIITYNNELEEAVQQIKLGNFINHEDVLKESDEW